ncbi:MULTISPECIES: ABC transporter substrate-binding protein [Rhodomicrobium]|uniref:ABC transporter substrate-binding protein n=1 Tax=Rhodomicrobium TaxID=1068 RepID=UPI000B4B8787|nr:MULTISPECIES: ABC transporter substrate-binding protein [Rhodomicrobium]
MRIRGLIYFLFSLTVMGASWMGTAFQAAAAEKVSVAFNSFSPYGAWYIVKERKLAKDIDLDIQVIDGIPEKNAAISSGQLTCMNNTVDTIMLARAGGVPIKLVAFSNMSYGLDKIVVSKEIKTVRDFKGKKYAADYGFLNHMWMLLTLRREGMGLKDATLVPMIAADSAAAFASGGVDIDVNFDPFADTSLKRKGSYVFKSSLTDRTWERGLIGDAIACNEKWLAEKPDVAKEAFRAYFEATHWWNENPEAGDEIVAKGFGWSLPEVKLAQNGAIQLNLSQNLGAFGLPGGKPLCESLPPEAPRAPKSIGWGLLFDGRDCAPGYAGPTWDLFNEIYVEAGVAKKKVKSSAGFDTSIVRKLGAEGYVEKYNSNKWVGRIGL